MLSLPETPIPMEVDQLFLKHSIYKFDYLALESRVLGRSNRYEWIMYWADCYPITLDHFKGQSTGAWHVPPLWESRKWHLIFESDFVYGHYMSHTDAAFVWHELHYGIGAELDNRAKQRVIDPSYPKDITPPADITSDQDRPPFKGHVDLYHKIKAEANIKIL